MLVRLYPDPRGVPQSAAQVSSGIGHAVFVRLRTHFPFGYAPGISTVIDAGPRLVALMKSA